MINDKAISNKMNQKEIVISMLFNEHNSNKSHTGMYET